MSANKVTDRDIERLLIGETPEDPSLAVLIPVVDQIHGGWSRPPTPERVLAFARSAAGIFESSPIGTAVVASLAPTRRPRRRRLVPRLAVPLALVMLLSGLTGAAIAAEGTIPGDAFYGFGLVLEKVGIGRGGVEKRLSEAAELASRGDAAGALSHAAAAIAAEDPDDLDSAQAVSGLEQAIDQLTSQVPGESDEVRGRVAEMLQWMIDNAGLIHDPEAEPGAFGKGVAAMARQIAGQGGGSETGSSEESGAKGKGNGGVIGGPPEGESGPPTEGIPPNRP